MPYFAKKSSSLANLASPRMATFSLVASSSSRFLGSDGQRKRLVSYILDNKCVAVCFSPKTTHKVTANVHNSQYYCFLQLYYLSERWRHCDRSPIGLLGLRSDQFHFRLARCMDNRHLWTPAAASFHVPEHVLDITSRWILFLDPYIELCTSRHDRLLHLPL